MLEGYVISWAVTDPVTKEEVIANMPLSEFWRQVGENTIMYDDLGFYLEDGTSLPVNPPAPEPFQGMEEGDIITMLNEYITSDPSGQRDLGDDDDDSDASDPADELQGVGPGTVQAPASNANNTSKKAVNGSSRVFLGTVGFVILLILLGDNK
jgi:hypothetical protein